MYYADKETQTGPRLILPARALKLADLTLEKVVYDYQDFVYDSQAPPCCSSCAAEGLMTEPDGYCQHGFPSVLISLGLI